jgi:hypothetical protein
LGIYSRLFVFFGLLLLLAVANVQLLLPSSGAQGTAASSFESSIEQSGNNFSSTQNAIVNAYMQIHRIEVNGGNASALVPKLNTAIELYENAMQSSNATQANLYLQNATLIANNISDQASIAGDKVTVMRQQRQEVALGESFVAIAIAVIVYAVGGKLWRRYWLYRYRDYLVKPPNG